MEENFYYTELFEIYKDLLTDKQKEIFGMHYNLDLSLSEIAEEKKITRQNVSDTLKNVKEKLVGFEKALKIKDKTDKLIKLADEENLNKIKEIIES